MQFATLKDASAGFNPFGLQPGEVLSLSADVWQDAASAAAGQNATVYLFAAQAGGNWTVSASAVGAGQTSAGARASGSVTLPASASDMASIVVGLWHQGGTANTAGTVYADRIQVERGGVSTQYKPGAQPGATVGAPSGTYVAGQLAQDLVTTASNAATTAGNAASNASSALSTLQTMRSNGYLDASEKPAIIRQWQAISNEESGIYGAGTTYGLTALRDAYASAYNSLASYLNGLSPSWSDTATDTPITPATDQATWAAYYSARQALLNAVSDAAAVRAVWANVSGTGKPADNATVGATFGTNISGQAATGDIGSTAISELATFTGGLTYSNIS